jgi:hypothetical protein
LPLWQLIEIQDTLAGPPPDYYHQPASRTALASLSQFLSAAHSGAAAAADSDASDTASPKAGEVAHNGSDEGKAGSERGPQGALDAPGPDDRQRWQVRPRAAVQAEDSVCAHMRSFRDPSHPPPTPPHTHTPIPPHGVATAAPTGPPRLGFVPLKDSVVLSSWRPCSDAFVL